MTSLSELYGTEQPVALITGAGSRRLGQVVARRLHREGCRVILHANTNFEQGKNVARELEQQGPEAEAFAADLRDADELDRFVNAASKKWGRVDILVHCAAIWYPQPLEEILPEDLDAFYAINQKASFLIAQKIGLQMTSQPSGGSIVLMGDWADARPYLHHASYFMSKGSIPMLTRVFAVELASRNPNVRVNAVLPGPVTLPKSLTETQYQAAVAGTLVHREGSPDDVAGAALGLIQNRFITGTCLPVDGGRTIYSGGDDYKQVK